VTSESRLGAEAEGEQEVGAEGEVGGVPLTAANNTHPMKLF